MLYGGGAKGEGGEGEGGEGEYVVCVGDGYVGGGGDVSLGSLVLASCVFFVGPFVGWNRFMLSR